MNRGLEALKVLVMSSTTIFNTKEQIKNAIDTIEKELKESENYKVIYRLEHEKNQQLTQANLKMSKTLEAIKRNPILIIRLLTNNATYKYVVEVTNENERPTQEEWDLLKEVIL